MLWKPFAAIDLVFLVLFLVAYFSLGQPERETPAASPTGGTERG